MQLATLATTLMLLVTDVCAGEQGGRLTIAFVTRGGPIPRPVSPLDEVAKDEGLAGARLGLADNETTGRFLGLHFALKDTVIPPGADVTEALGLLGDQNIRFIIADLPTDDLRAASSVAAERNLILFNTRSADDRLRNDLCHPRHLLHVVPSRAMLADALAQYLVTKRWRRWLLIVGPDENDRAFAEAVRRAAKRFGGKIVEEKTWRFSFGAGRADTGHVTLQTEIPAFTRSDDHDVLVVSDEGNAFGDYLLWRTASPRPVAGTQGLVPTAWSPVHEQWGASQLKARFEHATDRHMTARDYTAWLAARALGEATVRTRSTAPDQIEAYMRGPDFALGGFKGQPLSFRPWDGQLRQPILLAGPRLLVSASPQPGFLHEGSELDTLGYDARDSACTVD